MMTGALDWAAIINGVLGLGVVTTGLIGLVLLLRRPIAYFLGSDAVYLLWALPFLRLFMPNIQLPVKPAMNLPWPSDFYQFEMFENVAPLNEAPAVIETSPTITEAAAAPLNWPLIIVMTWILIGAAWVAWQLYRHVKYWHLLNHVSEPISEDLKSLSQKASDIIGLTRLPQIKIAPENVGPVVSGIFKPLIILPCDFKTIYSKDEQLYATCHELAHIKRKDLWVALAALMFRAVHWYNPFVHYAARRFYLDQESACDAFLLSRLQDSDKLGYAQTLLKAQSDKMNNQPANLSRANSLSLALLKEKF